MAMMRAVVRHICLEAAAVLVTAVPIAAGPVDATRTMAPPVIDGRLDDACWREAPAASGFLINNTALAAQYGTHVRAAWDDDALYFAVRCDEPDIRSIQTRPLERDDSDVWRTDCIEIMLDPGQTRNDYYHIGVNASGSVADRVCTQGGHIGDMSWDAAVEAASLIGDGYWSCEVAIPLYSLGIGPGVGSIWGLNVCREKKLPAENSSLSEQGAFNIASRFAELRGIDADLSRYCYSIGQPAAAQRLVGGNVELTLEVPLRNDTGAVREVLLDAWLVSPSGRVFTTTASVTPQTGQAGDFAIGPISLCEQGEYVCQVRVADPLTKKPLAHRKLPLAVEYIPIALKLVQPWYRNAIFATQNLKQIVVQVDVSSRDGDAKAARLEVRIVGEARHDTLAQTSVALPGESSRVTFDSSALPEGKMRVVAALLSADGGALAETDLPLQKLSRKQGEVWLGDDMNWRVDGEPFFLNGAWNHEDGFVLDYNAFNGEKPGDVKLLDTAIMSIISARVRSLKEDELAEADGEMLRAYVRDKRETPKLLAYFICDEPEVANIKAGLMEQIYSIFAEEDPYHPVIISNDSMQGLHSYARCAEINGLHPYPVILRDRRVNDLGSVAAFVAGAVKAFEGQDHRQTIAYLHQGFNYGDYGAVNNRIPTYVEYRNQDLLSLICGGRGFIQFNRMVTHYPELYIGMPHLTRELAYLGPILLAPTSPATPAASSEAMKMLLKEHDGDLYLLACNAAVAPGEVTVTVPGIGRRADSLRVISEGRAVELAGDSFTDRFDTYEVHVYTTGEAPDLPTVAAVTALIADANSARRKPGNLVYQAFEGDGVAVTASSSRASRFRRPDTGLWHVADGIVDQVDRYKCLGWYDDTEGEFPDWLEIRLPQPRTVGRVVVYPFQRGLRDYTVQVHVAAEWRDVDTVTDQEIDEITHTFDPVTTDRIRLLVNASNGPNAMVTEVEVYER